MKLLIFTEGTILMHLNGKKVDRKERVRQSETEGILGEERKLAYEDETVLLSASFGSVYDLRNYIPIGNSDKKVQTWVKQGVEVCYLSSRRVRVEIEIIRNILNKFQFPNVQNLYFRKQNQDYKDLAEEIMPDILIEDDCESIGGKKEMTITHVKKELRDKIKSIVVREFEGIDHLPDDFCKLLNY